MRIQKLVFFIFSERMRIITSVKCYRENSIKGSQANFPVRFQLSSHILYISKTYDSEENQLQIK